MSRAVLESVEFMSREKAVKLPGKNNVAFISIHSSKGVPAGLKPGWGGVIHLAFDDVVPGLDPRTGLVTLGGANIVPFNESHAKKLLEFVDGLHECINHVYVHCDAGISRSAAVARFLSVRHACPLIGDDRYANSHVLSVLNKVDRTYERFFGSQFRIER